MSWNVLYGGALSAEADWIARSSAAGVLFATRFDAQSDLTNAIFQDAKAGNWSWDSTLSASGTHSARCAVLDADGASNGAIVFYIDPVGHTVYGNGGEFWIAFRQYMPAAFCQSAFPGTGGIDPGFANGFKSFILSEYYTASGGGSSDVIGEIVMENTRQFSAPQMYWQDSGGSDHAIESTYNGTNFRLQNQINNAGIADPSGTLGYPAVTQKYGPVYPFTSPDSGTPDPNNGGYVYQVNGWQTFILHVRVGTFGSSNTLIEQGMAYAGQPPLLVHKTTTANPGQNPHGGYEGITYLPYCTLRTSNGGFDTFTCYDEIIHSTQPIQFPGGYSLSWS